MPSTLMTFIYFINSIEAAELWLQSKSLYRSRAGRHFYGTENVIWAGFGLVGSVEKKWVVDYEQLLRVFFSCFPGQKKS